MLTICLALPTTFSLTNRVYADDFNSYNYSEEMSYNLLKAETLKLSFYAHFSYAFAWMPYFNNDGMPYRYMLRNRHHGVVFGGGVAINKNYLLGISFEILSKTSHMRGEFSNNYREISGIKSSVFMTNFDVGVRLPMGGISPNFLEKIFLPRDIFRQRLNIYIVGGFNIISASLRNSYNSTYTMVPTSIAKSPNKNSLGINAGLAFTYKVFSIFHIRTEVRRMWIITRRSSLPSDSWLFNLGLGLSF